MCYITMEAMSAMSSMIFHFQTCWFSITMSHYQRVSRTSWVNTTIIPWQTWNVRLPVHLMLQHSFKSRNKTVGFMGHFTSFYSTPCFSSIFGRLLKKLPIEQVCSSYFQFSGAYMAWVLSIDYVRLGGSYASGGSMNLPPGASKKCERRPILNGFPSGLWSCTIYWIVNESNNM